MVKNFLITLFFCFTINLTTYNLFAQDLPTRLNRPEIPAERTPRYLQQRQHQITQPATLNTTEFTLSIGSVTGSIKPLLGINAGPIPSGDKQNADVTKEYTEYGITTVRTHDFYGPLDLTTIYPNIDADPSLPTSYNFTESDKVYQSILNAGCQPYIRVGDSYNNVRIPTNVQQRNNLVQAMCEQIRHYKNGSNNGFKSNFKYIEIWNEPDNKQFWPGNYEDFIPLFTETFKTLKQNFPDLKIGGPGFVVATYKAPKARKNLGMFLSYLQKEKVKLDFLSFHVYSNNPNEYYDAVNFYRNALEKAGFSNVELHMSEWNTENKNADPDYRLGNKASTYMTAFWIAMQQAKTDAAFLYRGTDTTLRLPTFYGIFYADGHPKPSALAFKLWKEFSQCTKQLSIKTGIDLLDSIPNVNSEIKPIWILAGEKSSKGLMLLISNIGNQKINYTIKTPTPIKSIDIKEVGGDTKEYSYKPESPTILIQALTVQLVKIDLE